MFNDINQLATIWKFFALAGIIETPLVLIAFGYLLGKIKLRVPKK